MAGTTTTATLGLVITAKDDAKAVFENFATNLSEQMKRIQENLTQGFDMTKAVGQVDEAATRMVEALDRVKIAEGEIGQIRAASEFESQMSEMAQSVNRMSETVTQGFARVEEQANRMNSSMHSAASGINYGEMMNAGAIMEDYGHQIMGFIGESMKAASEFDQSIKNVTASLNANLATTKLSKDQIDAMSRSALQMGSDGFFSANQIAEAMNAMAKSGLTYNEIMNNGIQTVKNVAAANQQDLEQTAVTVGDIYNEMRDTFAKTGLSAQEASQQIGNGMTVALHHSNLTMNDFLGTMKYVGPVASTVGLDFRDVATEIALLGQHGIKASQAGTTLRRELTNLIPQSTQAAAVMKELHLTSGQLADAFFDAKGQMLPLDQVQAHLNQSLGGLNDKMKEQAIKAIFGQYALAGMNAVVSTSPAKFKALRDEMNNNNLMSDIMATKSQGLQMQTQKLTAHFQTLQKEIGLMLAPVLTSLVGIANKLMDKWESLSPSIQKSIVYFTAITGAVLIVGGAIMTFVGTMGMLFTSFMTVSGSLASIGLNFTAVGKAIAIIGTIAAGVKFAWDKDIGGIQQITQKFSDWFSGIFSKTMSTAKKDLDHGMKELTKGFSGWNRSVMGPVNQAMAEIWTSISKGMQKLVQSVSNGITALTGWFNKMAPDFNKAITQIARLINWLAPVWKVAWEVIKIAAGIVLSYIVGIVQHFWGVFSGIIQLVTHLINGNWKAAFQDLWQIVKNSFLLMFDLWGGWAGKILGVFGKILEHTGFFGKAIQVILGPAFKFISTIVSATIKVAEGVFRGGMTIMTSVLKGFSGVVELIWKSISKLFSQHSSGAMNLLKKAWSAGVDFAKNVIHGFGIAVQDYWNFINKIFNEGPRKAIQFVVSSFRSGFQTVKDVLTGFGELVAIIFKRIYEFVATPIRTALTYLKTAWDEAVSKVTSVISNLVNKVKSEFTFIKDTVAEVIGAAMDIFQTLFGGAIAIVKFGLQGFTIVVRSIWQGIKDLITGHTQDAMTFFQRAFQVGISVVRGILSGLWGIVDSILGGLPSKFLGYANSAIQWFLNALSGGVGRVGGTVQGIVNEIGNILGNLGGNMFQWASNAIGMFTHGIQQGIGAIGNAVSGVADTIKNFLGMHSPARMGPLGPGESDKWFENMMGMFEKQINDNKDKVVKASMGVAVGVQQSIQATQQQVHSFVGSANTASTQAVVNNNNNGNNRQQVVNINIDGRSKSTDKQLAEDIFKQFRTQMSMVMG